MPLKLQSHDAKAFKALAKALRRELGKGVDAPPSLTEVQALLSRSLGYPDLHAAQQDFKDRASPAVAKSFVWDRGLRQKGQLLAYEHDACQSFAYALDQDDPEYLAWEIGHAHSLSLIEPFAALAIRAGRRDVLEALLSGTTPPSPAVFETALGNLVWLPLNHPNRAALLDRLLHGQAYDNHQPVPLSVPHRATQALRLMSRAYEWLHLPDEGRQERQRARQLATELVAQGGDPNALPDPDEVDILVSVSGFESAMAQWATVTNYEVEDLAWWVALGGKMTNTTMGEEPLATAAAGFGIIKDLAPWLKLGVDPQMISRHGFPFLALLLGRPSRDYRDPADLCHSKDEWATWITQWLPQCGWTGPQDPRARACWSAIASRPLAEAWHAHTQTLPTFNDLAHGFYLPVDEASAVAQATALDGLLEWALPRLAPGPTPLHLDRFPVTNIHAKEGATLLHVALAMWSEHPRAPVMCTIANRLVAFGQDVHAPDANGLTPLDWFRKPLERPQRAHEREKALAVLAAWEAQLKLPRRLKKRPSP